ncbi:hypothetical protein WJX73_002386 [Symbiochloris irregularis]|uniref:Uncharacterized protein n=1 Tax=Symbiochloris irregularis TaxID=706552 RepID=A0AAW1NLR7_9CHLO
MNTGVMASAHSDQLVLSRVRSWHLLSRGLRGSLRHCRGRGFDRRVRSPPRAHRGGSGVRMVSPGRHMGRGSFVRGGLRRHVSLEGPSHPRDIDPDFPLSRSSFERPRTPSAGFMGDDMSPLPPLPASPPPGAFHGGFQMLGGSGRVVERVLERGPGEYELGGGPVWGRGPRPSGGFHEPPGGFLDHHDFEMEDRMGELGRMDRSFSLNQSFRQR